MIILGTAPCLEEDLAMLFTFFVPIAECDFTAVGLDCAHRYLGRIEHAVSYHAKDFKEFRERRKKAGGNLDYITHSHNANGNPDRIWPYFSPSGSSAMLGVEVAIGLAYEKVICAGVLLEDKEYRRFQEGWKVRYEKIKDKVRALSGFPRELLGPPSKEWLNG